MVTVIVPTPDGHTCADADGAVMPRSSARVSSEVPAVPVSRAFPLAEDLAWFRHGDAGMPAAVRRATTALATRLGYAPARVEEIGIAVQEAATNVHRHADDGALVLRSIHAGEFGGIELVAVDSGPGIPDVAWASLDGNSTAGTLGIGLGGIFRLADDADLYSIPGRGTTLVLRFRLDRRAAPWPADVAGLTRPITGETVCGDAYAVRRDDERTTLMLCDGLGHGPLAARASTEAVRAFLAAPAGRPDAHVGVVHRALVGTRGGAVSVAELDRAAGVVRFCGVGNVSGVVFTDSGRRGMAPLPGIAGQHARSLRLFEYPL